MNGADAAWWCVQGVAVALWGLLAGYLANQSACLLRWEPQRFSPWAKNHPRDQHDHWLDVLPVIGWWRLRRKSRELGNGFWIRGIVVETASMLGFVALFVWEIGYLGLLPWIPFGVDPADVRSQLYGVFIGHLVLATAMLSATLVDFDEKTIPDEITVTGTLLGLILAAVVPIWLLPAELTAQGQVLPTLIASPQPWPAAFARAPQAASLALGLGCFGLWCFGLLHRPWRTRRGILLAVRILAAAIVRQPLLRFVLAIAIVGSAGITFVWWWGGWHWVQLLSALVGLVGGGLLVWITRIIGHAALRREAMGFGDVTLLAMIGVYLGWQAALMTFFLAPFAGVILGAVQWALHRDNEIPYGPFLCLAAVGVIVGWARLWETTQRFFEIPWLLPAALAACFVAAYFMLWGVDAAKRRML